MKNIEIYINRLVDNKIVEKEMKLILFFMLCVSMLSYTNSEAQNKKLSKNNDKGKIKYDMVVAQDGSVDYTTLQ